MGLGPGKAAADRVRLTPEQLQRATFEAVRALVSTLVGAGPTVLVLEDLHWADPTSLHLTEELPPSPNRARYCWSSPTGPSLTRVFRP